MISFTSVGYALDVITAISGVDVITGERVTGALRYISVIPIVGKTVRTVGKVGGAVSGVANKVNKNSRSYKGETHVYAVREPDGNVYKIGESAAGTRLRDGASKRAEKQVRALNRKDGPGYTSEIRRTFPDKDSARTYETNLIERYRSMYGQDKLPGNKTNR